MNKKSVDSAWPPVKAPPDAWTQEMQRIARADGADAAMAWAATKTKNPTMLRQLAEVAYLADPHPEFDL